MKSIEKLGCIDNAGQITIDSESFAKGLLDYTRTGAHRKDLRRAARMEDKNGKKIVYVKYASMRGVPDVEEMTNYITANYLGFRPNFENADHDQKNHVIAIEIEKDDPIVRVANMEAIPNGFKAIGSGLYKEGENVWTLKKDETGNLFLTRSAEEKPIQEKPTTDVFKVAKVWERNQSVKLGTGETGKIVSFDKAGNCVVKLDGDNNKLKIVSANLLQGANTDEVRDQAEGDLDKFYTELITKEHKPDSDQSQFYKDLIADPKI